MGLIEFIKNKLQCSQQEAETFVKDFRKQEAIDFGHEIIQSYSYLFDENYDVDNIEDETAELVAERIEAEMMSETSEVEISVLREVFGKSII